MLIHGKLILTQHGFLLDEVKSLLQKALRRKDRALIASSAKELSGQPFKGENRDMARDQLQWKALVNYLFEDHCLSDTGVLQRFHQCFQKKDKMGAVELLSECFTCRVAACLPVIAMSEEYQPGKLWNRDWRKECENVDWKGLVISDANDLDFDQILYHLKDAWKKKNVTYLITCFKLCSMVIDIDKGHPSKLSEGYLLSKVKKPNIGHVLMSFLYKHTDDQYWQEYLKSCFYLLEIPDLCIRLVLFSIVAHVKLQTFVKTVDLSQVTKVDWENVEKLTSMPTWAVDKHTFRGKFGKGTRHLLSKKDIRLNDEEKEEFHGTRPKADLQNFFEEGCICSNETLAECGNPYWEKTKNMYYDKPPKLQKTIHMTGVYYDELKKLCPFLFKVKRTCIRKPQDQASASKTQEPRELKRKLDNKESSEVEEPVTKKVKSYDRKDGAATCELAKAKGPLLQLPTGSAKVYTWVDLATQKVWKGPYRQRKYNLTLFFHKGLKEVLKDVHTLDVDVKEPYLIFPLLQGKDASLKITKMDIYDCIAKQQVQQQEFIKREDLAVVQLHRLEISQVKLLPFTLWLHFMYRFLFNIGDSGLYNAITDKELAFVYGIDMEENRSSVKGMSLLNLMFTKLPAKAYCSAIMQVLPSQKEDLKKAVESISEDHMQRLKDLSLTYQVSFDSDMFLRRRKQLISLLK